MKCWFGRVFVEMEIAMGIGGRGVTIVAIGMDDEERCESCGMIVLWTRCDFDCLL